MNPFRLFLFLVMPVCLSVACSSYKTAVRLNDIACYIQSRPDSALAVLRGIDTTALSTQALRAHYSLLYAMALDKNWIDTNDVSVVMPAVTYYSHHKVQDRRTEAYYYLGRIQYNGCNYDEAIISFTHAREYGENTKDYRLKSLIFQALGDTYGMNYLFEEALAYSDSSYHYCVLAEDTLLMNSSLFRIAQNLSNLNRFNESDSVYQMLFSFGPALYPEVIPKVYAGYGLLQISMYDDYENAALFFEKALSLAGKMSSYNLWGAYAYCLDRLGKTNQADKIFKSLSLSEDGLYAYQSWKSRTMAHHSDYSMAYDLSCRASETQTEGVRAILGQSVVKAQRDYYTLLSSSAQEKQQHRTIIAVLLSLLLFCLGLWTVNLYSRYKTKIAFQERRLLELALDLTKMTEDNKSLTETANILSEEVDRIRSRQEKIKKDYFKVNQKGFIELTSLCNTYFKVGENSEKAFAICAEVRSYLNSLGISGKNYLSLEKRVDELFDNVMFHLRQDYPDHREQFYQVACLLFAGFKVRTIALMTHATESSVYKQRSRLIKIIESHHSHYQNDYLLLLKRP